MKHSTIIEINDETANLLDRYAILESEIQKLINQICRPYCRRCPAICCEEEICRESIESPFLSMLIEKQPIRYDLKNGWVSSSGCRLRYGRPLVCYDFFCEKILKSHSFRAVHLNKLVADFVAIGNRAHGNTHLMCVDDLGRLAATKIVKMISRIDDLTHATAHMRRRVVDLKMEKNEHENMDPAGIFKVDGNNHRRIFHDDAQPVAVGG